jgi:predicted metallo-beta-lactamase superfamily hydrolase
MLGWVTMAALECGDECFVFAPDVQGPMSARAVEFIKAQKPQVLMVGGPPFYLGGFKVDERQLQRGISNLQSLAETVPIMVIEHHALRDEHWNQRIEPVYTSAASAGHRVMTAAEFAGEKNVFLESRRKQLYAENPPSKEFEKWMRLSATDLSHVKPPI